MRKLDVQQMVQFLDNYKGKQIELGLSSPIWSVQTYKNFGLNDTDNTFIFFDAGNKSRQELIVNKDKILDITLVEGEDIYDSVVSLELLDNSKIDFCISSLPVRCFKCHKIIEEPYDSKWTIQGSGGYGSKFDGCGEMNITVCDDCLYYDILGFVDGEFDLEEEKEKTCH